MRREEEEREKEGRKGRLGEGEEMEVISARPQHRLSMLFFCSQRLNNGAVELPTGEFLHLEAGLVSIIGACGRGQHAGIGDWHTNHFS